MAWGAGHSPRLGKSGWARQRENQAILERDGYRCYVPGCTRAATIVDHIAPLSQGGQDTDTNKAGICKIHHDAKTAVESALGRHTRKRPPEEHPGRIA